MNDINNRCPSCLAVLEFRTVSVDVLKEGCFTVCSNCGTLLTLGATQWEMATPEDTEHLTAEQYMEVQDTQHLIHLRGMVR